MKADILSHVAQEATLQAFFEARPYQIVTHDQLVELVGENYRSRISPLRKVGMVIENVPARKADGRRGYGSYRFRPQALGRDASDLHAAVPVHLPMFDGERGAYQRE